MERMNKLDLNQHIQNCQWYIEQIELQATLIVYFLWNNESNINQSQGRLHGALTGQRFQTRQGARPGQVPQWAPQGNVGGGSSELRGVLLGVVGGGRICRCSYVCSPSVITPVSLPTDKKRTECSILGKYALFSSCLPFLLVYSLPSPAFQCHKRTQENET